MSIAAEVRKIEARIHAPIDRNAETPEERLALWWSILSSEERAGLAVLGRMPMSCAYEEDFTLLDEKERAAILHSLKSMGVLADLVMYGSHGALKVAA